MADGREGLIWRRLAAGLVDGILFLVAASLASVALYAASGGVVRAFTFLPAARCEPMATVPDAVARAAQAALSGSAFEIRAAQICRRSFLGMESGRFVSLSLEARSGPRAMAAAVFQPVDRSGRPIDPLTMDWLYPLMFILLLSVCGARLGVTPGMSALGLRVAAAGGGPMGLSRALARNLIVHGWLAVGALTSLGGSTFANVGFVRPVWIGGAGLLAVAALAMLALGRPDPAFDRWTGLRVVRA